MSEKEKEGEPFFEPTLLELFKVEIETQVKILSEGLLSYRYSKGNFKLLEPLMRAAHSLKGAAKVFSFDVIVQLSHAMEDSFVAAQENKISLNDDCLEILFKSLDALADLIHVPSEKIPSKIILEQKNLEKLTEEIKKFTLKESAQGPILIHEKFEILPEDTDEKKTRSEDQVLRLSAQSLNRLMGLAAEAMVETRWLHPFCAALQRLKSNFHQIVNQLDELKKTFGVSSNEEGYSKFLNLNHTFHKCHNELSNRVADLELFITRHSNLTDRFHDEIIESRMRPFADAVDAFPRMVWKTAKQLNKKARLEIFGKSTLIDRDVLEKLETPLGHLLRNAIDHGIGTPEERIAAGKLPEGVIRLEATDKAGKLYITVSDDGKGVDLNLLRKKIIDQGLMQVKEASQLSEEELLNFLFLPGFTMSSRVTELSGRGIGLDIIKNLLQELSGRFYIENHPGQGLSFHLELPLTLSVIRALIVKIGKGIFAFPLARIDHAATIMKSEMECLENHKFFKYSGQNVSLFSAYQVLYEKNQLFNLSLPESAFISLIVLRNQSNYYGIVVDEFLGEKELVLQDVEFKLGKIPYISSGSVLENGDPVFIISVDDFLKMIDQRLRTSCNPNP